MTADPAPTGGTVLPLKAPPEHQGGQVVDIETGEVLPLTGTAVPFEQYDRVRAERDQRAEELAAVNRALAAAERRIKAQRLEIDDLLEQAADRDTVMRMLEWWKARTGRNGNTRLTLSGSRARHVRWLLRKWTPRECCVMVVGILNEPWYAQRGLSDWKHICTSQGKYDEAKLETFLGRGYRALGLNEDGGEPSAT